MHAGSLSIKTNPQDSNGTSCPWFKGVLPISDMLLGLKERVSIFQYLKPLGIRQRRNRKLELFKLP